MSESLEERVTRAAQQPQNLGELKDADAVGTAGSPGCGDMLRIWLRYGKDEQGARVIDQASFQSFGCETAMAVASVATEMLVGKTTEEAARLSSEDLSAPLGALPPMKIHCATLVEEALRQALEGGAVAQTTLVEPAPAEGLSASLQQAGQSKKIVFLTPTNPLPSSPS
jgi:nitrogen fixation protein NifU and related proteins